ncbi:hypothetical protein DAEQUDRAFT_704451 [Daedalea quercina L-15889]|uniref:RAVE complex protein Rav1 C-terminal domain-containing protein n=1 Tax=Daedalea quercina L-15889 TaxID=1314783 RepID=A0A165T1D2_9APHY|nr:hypothetical protein DAEQUDRAFT_704451 [Daedalea quercina L-15889]
MLDLLQAYTGCPTTSLQFLALPRETLLLYPSLDSIIIVNARTLAFLRALAFWEVFPGTRHTAGFVRCLTVDSGMKLVVASMASRVAVWSLSTAGGYQVHDSWRLHSSTILPQDQEISALDCKSGLLAVGTRSSLSVYTLTLENDLPTWSRKWTYPTNSLARVRFSPSLMYIATTSSHDSTVRLHLTTSGRRTQVIPHPRPVSDISWRNPGTHAQNRNDDPILYTTTADGTLRVFLSVLDAPQRVQLHAALDAASSIPLSSQLNSLERNGRMLSSAVFPLDRDAVLNVLKDVAGNAQTAEEDARSRRVREIAEEGWDLFLRVLVDGSLVVQAISNVDRRPPTLLKQFTLLQSSPGLLPSPPPEHLYVIATPSDPGTLTLVTSPPLAVYVLSPLPFFDARADGLKFAARGADQILQATERIADEGRHEVIRFVRTPEGEGVGAVYADGSGEVWRVKRGGGLERRGKWHASDNLEKVERVVVLDGGTCFVTYTSQAGAGQLTLYAPTPATLSVPPLVALFSLPVPSTSSTSLSRTILAVTESYTIFIIYAKLSPEPSLSLRLESSLPLPTPPRTILPVDPMAWSGTSGEVTATSADAHDTLLSISEDGELAFWVPENGLLELLIGDVRTNGAVMNGEVQTQSNGWRCTGGVRTGRRGLSRAACSSAKKSVLVVPTSEGEELTIWDSKISEFSSGLEYQELLNSSDPIKDLDWTATPDAQSILAIGFAHHVELLSQQRMTYYDDTPGWGRCHTIDIGRMLPHQIGDSIWLARGSLLVGAGHHLCMFGQGKCKTGEERDESLFELVARQNGPLDDYHPQMMLQCLLWEKIELVKQVIVNLAKNIESEKTRWRWQRIPLEEFFKKDEVVKAAHASRKPQYSLLFSTPETSNDDEEDSFSRSLVERLLERLEESPLPHLTPNEHASLLVLIQTTLEIEEQRRALDANGVRYLISMRAYYISHKRLSAPGTPASGRSGMPDKRIKPRQRLRYRDMIWAFHSESQELLLSQSVAACGGKMTWSEARSLGVFLWLRSSESMKAHMEVVARNQYMAGDNRDPTACSLFYFALGKAKLVLGLWRQAAWHKEQTQMLKFLSNDFTQARWRTVALKNAFALLSKRRFEYAAAFFLLGGSLKDAVNVCIRNLDDFQLAVALARVVESGDNGPILQGLLKNSVLPIAFKDGNRWLASWAFWLLHRRDLAVRILLTPLPDIASVLDVRITEIGDPHYDDPSLALLFSQLKSRTLQTAKGTSEISGRTEFNFVLQIARVFSRMGCHVLALDLVRTWSFQRPSVVVPDSKPLAHPEPSSPVSTRLALEPALRHRASVLIDMDPVTAPSTRSASPVLNPANAGTRPQEGQVKDEGDTIARKAGLGSLMKTAKQNVAVPEFDMSAFF